MSDDFYVLCALCGCSECVHDELHAAAFVKAWVCARAVSADAGLDTGFFKNGEDMSALHPECNVIRSDGECIGPIPVIGEVLLGQNLVGL